MKHSILKAGLSIALSSLPLAACVDGGYGYGVGSTWASQPYDGWYDGYYGPIYDGYWGSDNYFYYRQNERDHYRRGDRRHFQRGMTAPDPHYRRLEGQTQPPPRGTRMPHYPRQDNGDRGDRHSHGTRSSDRHEAPY